MARSTITVNDRLNAIIESSQGRTYLVVAITLLVITLMIFLAIAPAYKSITDQLALNQVKAQYLADLNTKSTNLQKLAAQEQQYSSELTLLDSYLPAKDNSELVTANISKIAEANNCKLGSVSFGVKAASTNPKIPAGGYPNLLAVPLNISLTCAKENISGLIKHLEELPMVIYFNSVGYSYKQGESSTYSLAVTGEYYFWNLATPQ